MNFSNLKESTFKTSYFTGEKTGFRFKMMKKVIVPVTEEIPTSGFLTRFLIYTAVVSFIAAVKWLMDGKLLFLINKLVI